MEANDGTESTAERLAGKNESRHIQNEKLHTNKDCAEILSGE